MKVEGVTIRPATTSDLHAIGDIYTHYVLNSTCTYQIHPDTPDQRKQWFRNHGQHHPVVVAEINGRVVGWGSLSRYHSRCAFEHTVEDSVYIQHDMQGRGIGRSILEELISRAKALNHHTIVALIGADQPTSLALHRKFGFVETGRYREVGKKFGKWLDMVFMQKML